MKQVDPIEWAELLVKGIAIVAVIAFLVLIGAFALGRLAYRRGGWPAILGMLGLTALVIAPLLAGNWLFAGTALVVTLCVCAYCSRRNDWSSQPSHDFVVPSLDEYLR